MAGLYIHIPFCASRCIYCGFYSTTGKENTQDRYISALLKEFSLRKDYLKNEPIHTIYIGGGTPSLLSLYNIKRLTEGIGGCDGEFTMECNPDDITPALAQTMKEAGINRVSMGVQTFSDERLKFLRRRHHSEQIAPAIAALRDAGIKNISTDLMFGFPGETLEEWQADLNKAIDLEVEHISAYSLMYEEGTALYSMLQSGKIKENEEEISVTMYDMLIDTLCKAGYEQYEISNFAKPGFRSKHNSNYWNGTLYLGLGAAAHSFDGNSRQWNISDISKYISSMDKDFYPEEDITEKELLDEDTKYNDLVTTALRTKEGIDLGALKERYYKYIIMYARKGIDEGILKIEDNHLSLTRKGLYISDDVMSDLVKV